MIPFSRWSMAPWLLLIAVPYRPLPAQVANDLRLGVGQHVRVFTRDGVVVDGLVRVAIAERVILRVSSEARDSSVSVERTDIARAEVAMPQEYRVRERNALIGGVVGLAVGALSGLAVNKSESCTAAETCWHIDLVPLASAIGLGAGLLAGWFQASEVWVPAKL